METHWGAHVSPWVYCGATHAFLILLLLMGYTVPWGWQGGEGGARWWYPPSHPSLIHPFPSPTHPLPHFQVQLPIPQHVRYSLAFLKLYRHQ